MGGLVLMRRLNTLKEKYISNILKAKRGTKTGDFIKAHALLAYRNDIVTSKIFSQLQNMKVEYN